MVERPVRRVALVPVVLLLLLCPGRSGAAAPRNLQLLAAIAPADTVVLANAQDARFARDFSVLLAGLRLEWVILEDGVVPERVRGLNLILIGRPDSVHTGDLLRELLTPAELDEVRAAGRGTVLDKESPWGEGRRVLICAGADLLEVRDAAEEAVRSLTADALPASAWYRTRFDTPMDETARATVERMRFTWDDDELPLAELTIEVGAKPRRVTAAEAKGDVERLFDLFSHGYAGYGYFGGDGAFARARAAILERVNTQSKWSAGDLATLFYEELGFITDCHMNIGAYQFARHADFWYDTTLELTPGADGFRFTADGAAYTVAAVDGRVPDSYLFPSLNAEGEPIYRLGVLSAAEPASLRLDAGGDDGVRTFEIALERSDFTHFSDDYFREDVVGGIPVIRVRNFGDTLAEELSRFVATGRAHSGDPVVIVDIRGNGGGNEAWPIAWIQGLTGRRAESVFIFSELSSKTTMAGRVNVFADLADRYPGTESFERDRERYATPAAAFESGTRQPRWSGPVYPTMGLIPNDTTVIIVMNGLVASAGEGLVMRASRAENVVLVGENSMGCLTYGNSGLFFLPHSRLRVQLPINFGLYLDMESREEVGLSPDLWVPAADAVNYAVAAVRRGTISTQQPLPESVTQAPFEPEDPWARAHREKLIQGAVIAMFPVAGGAWAYAMRRRPPMVAATGFFWTAFGGIWVTLQREAPVGYGLALAGCVCLVWGGIGLWRNRGAAGEIISGRGGELVDGPGSDL